MPAPVIRRVIAPVVVARPVGSEGDEVSEDAQPVVMGAVSVQATFFGSNCAWFFVTDCNETLPSLGAGTVGILAGDGRSVLKTPLLEVQESVAAPHAMSLMASGNIDEVSSGAATPQSTFAAGLAHRLVKKYSNTVRLVAYAFCSVSEPKFVGTSQSGISSSAVAFSAAVFAACCRLVDEHLQ